MTAIFGEAEAMSAGAEDFLANELRRAVDHYAGEVAARIARKCCVGKETFAV